VRGRDQHLTRVPPKSPDGGAPIDIKPRFNTDDLKLSEGRRKRLHTPEAKPNARAKNHQVLST
jgi:hypothetical protein